METGHHLFKTDRTKSQEKASRSFDYACRQASKGRHEKCHISCYSCPDMDSCDIQRRIEIARKKIN